MLNLVFDDKIQSMDKVRTRFAPSPTGYLHIGGLRSALYPYALARHAGGSFILRIEDTDQKRFVKGAVESLKTTLSEFGIGWDEYYVQSERTKEGIYKRAAEKLVSTGHAFYCKCLAKNAKSDGYSKELRDPCRNKNYNGGAIKLMVPDGENVSYHDFVLDKEIFWDTSTVSDATLLKSDGFPTYHLASVVDDSLMNISHVLRGHDWMPSTPIHLLVYKYLGNKVPKIGHMTDILDPEGGKLSKRKGSVSCEDLLSEGYLKEAILNFVMLLGWAPKDNSEIMSMDQFIKAFDPNGFQKANPVFNRDKLDWFNGEYIRKLNDEKLCEMFEERNGKFKALETNKKLEITKLVKERIKKISDLDSIAGFFFTEVNLDKKLLGKNFKNHLEDAIEVVESTDDWTLDRLNQKLMDRIKQKGYKTGDFFMDLRIAITGSKFTPPINDSIIILGKNATINRIKKVLGNQTNKY